MTPISSGRASDGRYDVHEAIDDIEREANMSDVEVLIPPPALVRERLARNVSEARVLRSLLRLSVQIADAKDRTKHSGRTTVPLLEGATR